MGRITIFSIHDCPFCRRTKAALSSRDIPYAEILIDSHPSKRADMISLTDRLTVPQIFFNEEHIGGSDETLAVLAKWDDDIAKKATGEGDESPRERYVRLIGSEPDPADERLAVPEGEGASHKSMDFETSRTKEITEIEGKRYTTLELTKMLIQKMPCDSLTYWSFTYHNVFCGTSGVAALQEIFHLESKEKAIQLGKDLQRKNYITHVVNHDHDFGENSYYFQLCAFNTPAILNSFYWWKDPVVDEPMYVIHRLGKLWSRLESRHLNDDGMVDHATLRVDDLYHKFEEEVCELQSVSLETMDDRTRKAFVINAYNLGIKYAYVKVGIAATAANRSSFFDDVLINLGGALFSFNELEHGIMRANTRHPYKMTKPFGNKDARRALALEQLDCRVHFALNCGAKSCPPVKKYTAEAIEEELALAAMAFCEAEDNVAVDEENRQVHFSKILYWYMADFAASKDDLPQKIAQYLRGEKKEKVDKLLRKDNLSGKITVKFLEYNWSSNDINFQAYEKGQLSIKSARMPSFASTGIQRRLSRETSNTETEKKKSLFVRSASNVETKKTDLKTLFARSKSNLVG